LARQRRLPLAHRRALEAFGEAMDPDALLSAEEQYARSLTPPRVPAASLEQAAERVVGVYSCRVRLGEEAAPARVRLVVRHDRRFAAAKDVQSAWFALFGVYVPRGRFDVLPVRGGGDPAGGPRRLALRGCAQQGDGRSSRATVRLAFGQRTWEAVATGPRGADGQRLAAQATASAVEAWAGRSVRVTDLQTVQLHGGEAVVVAVDVGEGTELLGVARERGDGGTAAARAVLDAVNRWLAAPGRAGP